MPLEAAAIAVDKDDSSEEREPRTEAREPKWLEETGNGGSAAQELCHAPQEKREQVPAKLQAHVRGLRRA